MFLATIFMLLSLLTFGLTVIGFIKPSIVLKNKEMKWKRLKIGASGMLSCFILLILSAIFAPEQDIHPEEENKNQQQASTQAASQEQAKNQPKEQPKEQAQTVSSNNKSESHNPNIRIYDNAIECIEDTAFFTRKDETLKVISPNEFILTHSIAPTYKEGAINIEFWGTTSFIFLHTFAHTNIDELTIHINPKYANRPHMKNDKNLPSLELHKITLHAKRKDVLAYMQKYLDINSFDELTDKNENAKNPQSGALGGTLPSEKFKKIFAPTKGSELVETWALVNMFKVQ